MGKAKVGRPHQALIQSLARTPQPRRHHEFAVDHMETRRIVEPETAARADEESVAEIAGWLTAMESVATRGDSVTHLDSAFHVSIAKATGNDTLRGS